MRGFALFLAFFGLIAANAAGLTELTELKTVRSLNGFYLIQAAQCWQRISTPQSDGEPDAPARAFRIPKGPVKSVLPLVEAAIRKIPLAQSDNKLTEIPFSELTSLMHYQQMVARIRDKMGMTPEDKGLVDALKEFGNPHLQEHIYFAELQGTDGSDGMVLVLVSINKRSILVLYDNGDLFETSRLNY